MPKVTQDNTSPSTNAPADAGGEKRICPHSRKLRSARTIRAHMAKVRELSRTEATYSVDLFDGNLSYLYNQTKLRLKLKAQKRWS